MELAERLIQAAQKQELSLNTSKGRLETYPNGLVKDIYYYRKDCDNFVVCAYGQSFTPVYSGDFQGLLKNQWTSNVVIDSAINSFMTSNRRKKFLNIRAEHSLLITTRSITDSHEICNIPLFGNTVIMPLNLGDSHWTLVVADFTEKTYRLLDPLNLANTSKCMALFLHFLEVRSNYEYEDLTVWKSMPAGQLPKQVGNVSCGIFVILYAALAMDAIPDFKSESFEVMQFRNYMAERLLECCPYMKHLCLKCGKDEFNNSPNESIGTMVECKSCMRWFHLKCALPKLISEEDYTCFLCESYFKRPHCKTSSK